MYDIYTHYDLNTGEILGSFSGIEIDIELNQPCIKGEYSSDLYRIVNGIPTAKTQEELEQKRLEELVREIRFSRDVKLKKSDWTQVPDAPVDQEAWKVYRQELRDLPNQHGFPEKVIWPIEPN